MLGKIASFIAGWTLYIVAALWISMLAQAVPLMVQAEYDPDSYGKVEQALVSSGKPVWETAARPIGPIFGSIVQATTGIDGKKAANLLINRAPRDGAAYLQLVTSVTLMLIFLGIVPWLWRKTLRAFHRE